MRMQQVALRDAPDPRESRPPCYSDAIRMPRLDGSFASLDEISSNKRRKKNTNETDETADEEVPLRRTRCRSEEVLSMRDITSSRSSRVPPPRVHPFEVEQLDRQTFVDDDIQIQGSNVILNLDNSPRSSRARPQTISNSPAAATSSRPTNIDGDEIRNFNQSSNSVQRSPYTRRSKKVQKDDNNSDSVRIIDDHFQSESVHDDEISLSSSEFEAVELRKSENSSSDGFVVLKTGGENEKNLEIFR